MNSCVAVRGAEQSGSKKDEKVKNGEPENEEANKTLDCPKVSSLPKNCLCVCELKNGSKARDCDCRDSSDFKCQTLDLFVNCSHDDIKNCDVSFKPQSPCIKVCEVCKDGDKIEWKNCSKSSRRSRRQYHFMDAHANDAVIEDKKCGTVTSAGNTTTATSNTTISSNTTSARKTTTPHKTTIRSSATIARNTTTTTSTTTTTAGPKRTTGPEKVEKLGKEIYKCVVAASNESIISSVLNISHCVP